TQRGIDAARERQARQNAVRGLAAGTAPSLVPALGDVGDIISDEEVAAVEAAVRIIGSLNEVTEAGIAAAEERAEAERLLGIEIARRRFTNIDRGLLAEEDEAREKELQRLRQLIASMQALRRIQASHASVADAAADAEAEQARESRQLTAAYEARNRIVGSLADATQRGTEALEASGTETERLQRRIRNLTHAGFDPASE